MWLFEIVHSGGDLTFQELVAAIAATGGRGVTLFVELEWHGARPRGSRGFSPSHPQITQIQPNYERI